MTKPLCLVLLALIVGTACNWWPDYDGRVHHLRWTSNNVEFGQCVVGEQVHCVARESQMVNGCMPTEPTGWCEGQPLPDGVDSITVVDY